MARPPKGSGDHIKSRMQTRFLGLGAERVETERVYIIYLSSPNEISSARDTRTNSLSGGTSFSPAMAS